MDITYYHCNHTNSPTPEKIGEVLGLGESWGGFFDLSLVPSEGYWVVRGYSETTNSFFALRSDDWSDPESWEEIGTQEKAPGEMKFQFTHLIDWTKSGDLQLERILGGIKRCDSRGY